MLFDLAVAALILAAAAVGAWKGFALMAAAVLSPLAGAWFGGPLASRLAPQLGLSGPAGRVAAFALVYVALSFLIFAAALGIRRALERAGLRPWDRHLGAVSGALTGAVVAVALSCAAVAVREDLRDGLRATRSGRAMGAAVEALRQALPGPAREALDPFLAPLRPAAEASVRQVRSSG
jgi:membrane protein required for colicin V production